MSERLPVVSGRRMVKFLETRGIQLAPRKSGSHIVMKKEGIKEFISVPDHKELKRVTMMSILRQAGISREEFVCAMRRR